MILTHTLASVVIRPSIFPTEDGGISFEWVDHNNFVGLEIQADSGLIDAMHLTVPDPVGVSNHFTHHDGLSVTETSVLIHNLLAGVLSGDQQLPKEMPAGSTEKETK